MNNQLKKGPDNKTTVFTPVRFGRKLGNEEGKWLLKGEKGKQLIGNKGVEIGSTYGVLFNAEHPESERPNFSEITVLGVGDDDIFDSDDHEVGSDLSELCISQATLWVSMDGSSEGSYLAYVQDLSPLDDEDEGFIISDGLGVVRLKKLDGPSIETQISSTVAKLNDLVD